MWSRVLFVWVLIIAPLGVSASVVISEVAWMGSSDNANAEWIELHNQGSDSIVITGWKIVSSTGSPTITLNGTMAPGSYYLLTRTSTSIIPGVTGDQAYTGALSNSGATITLTDALGGVIDEVVGGTNWTAIGGNNTTKETPQRNGNTWVTAVATPKAENRSAPSEPQGEVLGAETGTSTPEVTVGGSSVTSGVGTYALPKLYLVIGPNRIVSTHAKTPFRALVFDEKGKEKSHAEVHWSFGDGIRKRGDDIEHTYHAPGTYLVMVRAKLNHATAVRMLTVLVKDAEVRVGRVDDIGVEIVNEGDGILDLSGWQLKRGDETFHLPQDTALLPNMSVLFPHEVTGLGGEGEVSLHVASGKEIGL